MTAITADGLPAVPPTSNRIFATLQRIGRSLMLPIATMPAAGLLIRLGSDDILGVRTPGDNTEHGLYLGTYWHFLIYVEKIFAAAGNGIFNFLPLLFAEIGRAHV